MVEPIQEPSQEQSQKQEVLDETGKEKETLENRLNKTKFFKKSFFSLSLGSFLVFTYFTIAPCFVSKPEVIKQYESGVRVIKIIKDNDTYIGETLSRYRFRDVVDSLENDLENLRSTRNYKIESIIRENYFKDYKKKSYIGLALTTLAGLIGFAFERKECSYERRLKET